MNKSLLLTIVAALPAAALAGDVDMRHAGTGAGMTVGLNLQGDARDTFAGELIHEIINGGTLNGTHISFCPDPTEITAANFTNYTIENIEDIPILDGASMPMGMIKANAIRALYAAEFDTITGGSFGNPYAAAFQITMWEIVTDFDGTAGSIDVAAGDLIVTAPGGGALDATLSGHLGSIHAALADAIAMDELVDGLIGLGAPGVQDQIIIPAPGAIALLGLGGLVAARRRR